MKKIKPYLNFLTLSLLIIFSLGSFNLSLAQTVTSADKYTVLAPLPCIESAPTTYIDSSGKTQTNDGIKCDGGNGSVQKQVDFKTYVQYTMNLLIALSAVVAVVMLIWGGVEYMFTSSFTDKKEGLERAKHAIYGLLLVLTSYIILRTVDPRLVEIPNTLVPQLKISEWLTMDANQILMNKLEKQLNEYQLNSKDLGDLLQKTTADKLAKQNELANINKQIAALDLENRADQEKYQALEVERSRREDALKQIDIDFQTLIAKSAINGVLITSTDEASKTSSLVDGTDVMKQLIANKNNVDVYLNKAASKLQRLGDVQADEVYEAANVAKITIDLTKINVSINSAGSTYNSTGFGMTSSSIRGIELTKIDGKKETITPASKAKEYIQNEINKLKSSLTNIKDEKMKADLQLKIDDAQGKLDSSAIFNKK